MSGEQPGPDARDGGLLWPICIALAFTASVFLAGLGTFGMVGFRHAIAVYGICDHPPAERQSCEIGLWSRVWVAYGMLLTPVAMIVWGRRGRPVGDALGMLIWVMAAYVAAFTFVLSG